MRGRSERGAAAVEFALVMPLLLALVLGIVEFGHAYHVQTTLSGAAREGVREMALHNKPTDARAATKAAAPQLALSDGQIDVTPSNCVAGAGTPSATATVNVKYKMPFITDFFGTTITLTGKGVMRCNG